MPLLEAGSVDAIITDLPYGTTACEWDSIIPLAPMWEAVKRVLKPSGVFITTSSQPFTTELIHSNIKFFKYSLVWHKSHAANFLNAKYMPLIKHEDILVFAKGSTTYNPQITKGAKKMNRSGAKLYNREDSSIYGSKPAILANVRNDEYQPTSVLEFSAGARMNMVHPTQKPLDLYRYLIRTYTNEGETVLDICMGSGTTIEAAEIEGRNSIGIEKETGYFQVAEKRAKQAVLQPNFFTPSNNRLHLDVGDSPAQQALFTPEADTAEGKFPERWNRK
jgi:site-specific DNA-methyltransferase (adenine-specific)